MNPAVVIDLETTGLDPDVDHTLEVACVAVDLDTLEELDTWHCVLPLPSDPEDWAPVVRDMHARNGLIDACWAEVCAAGVDDPDLDWADRCEELDAELAGWLAAYRQEGGVVLIGNSLHGVDVPSLRAMDDARQCLADLRQYRSVVYGIMVVEGVE